MPCAKWRLFVVIIIQEHVNQTGRYIAACSTLTLAVCILTASPCRVMCGLIAHVCLLSNASFQTFAVFWVCFFFILGDSPVTEFYVPTFRKVVWTKRPDLWRRDSNTCCSVIRQTGKITADTGQWIAWLNSKALSPFRASSRETTRPHLTWLTASPCPSKPIASASGGSPERCSCCRRPYFTVWILKFV